jgi:PhoH-like ATPase
MNKEQTLVLDTSAILNQPAIFSLLKNTRFIVPIEVLEELDGAKVKQDAIGFAARRANKVFDKFRKNSDLTSEFSIDDNNSMIISFDFDMSLLPSSYSESFDSRIIAVAKKYSLEFENLSLVSSDISMRVKAAAIGISAKSEDDVVFSGDDLISEKIERFNITDDELDAFYADSKISLDSLKRDDIVFYHNQPLILRSESGSSALAVSRDGFAHRLKTDKKDFSILGISPKNKEQRFAMDFMLDTKIPLVSVCGLAGSGKTMAAIAAALHMVDKGLYSKIVITRPVVSLSTNIGMLPGDKLDKMKPWIQPVFDNAKWLLKGGNGHIDLLIEKGVLEIESLSYIRGRTFPNTIFIVDECQNTTISEMKSIITRMGVNSKLILIGDIEQIDSPKIDMFNSGLSTVISKFKGTDLAAHVTLVKSERSELAALAAKIL